MQDDLQLGEIERAVGLYFWLRINHWITAAMGDHILQIDEILVRREHGITLRVIDGKIANQPRRMIDRVFKFRIGQIKIRNRQLHVERSVRLILGADCQCSAIKARIRVFRDVNRQPELLLLCDVRRLQHVGIDGFACEIICLGVGQTHRRRIRLLRLRLRLVTNFDQVRIMSEDPVHDDREIRRIPKHGRNDAKIDRRRRNVTAGSAQVRGDDVNLLKRFRGIDHKRCRLIFAAGRQEFDAIADATNFRQRRIGTDGLIAQGRIHDPNGIRFVGLHAGCR